MIKIVLSTIFMSFIGFGLFAKAESITRASVFEAATHDLIKLAKQKSLPDQVVEKMHMMRVQQVPEGFRVIAVLDHNQDHSQPPAHVRFLYNQVGELVSYEYKEGYFNPEASPFNKESSVKLFDIAAEFLLESSDAEILSFADSVMMMHLELDPISGGALFDMIGSDKREFRLILSLDGKVIEARFMP